MAHRTRHRGALGVVLALALLLAGAAESAHARPSKEKEKHARRQDEIIARRYPVPGDPDIPEGPVLQLAATKGGGASPASRFWLSWLFGGAGRFKF